jgi:predicted permease
MVADLVYAWRSILRMPLLALVVIGSLAVGIGANTAVFSWVEAIVLKPLPGVPGSGSYVFVEPRTDAGAYPGMSWPEYDELRTRMRTIPQLIAFRMVPFNLGDPARSERAFALLVSGNYFSALGLKPAVGRLVEPGDARQPDAEPVVVVSHEYWRSHLGGDPRAVGRTLRVNGVPLTVVGVAPERFQGTHLALNFSLFVPATMARTLLAGSQELTDRSLRGYSAMGTLTTDATGATAQAEVERVMRDLAARFPDTNRNVTGEVLPFWRAPRGPQRMFAAGVIGFQVVMLLLLLAVCGNVANLTLARASSRYREIGVRLSLGATRTRIVRLLLTEAAILGTLGAIGGTAIAVWATDAVRDVPITDAFPIRFQTSIDGLGLAFAAVLGFACSVVFGIAPAVQLARIDPQAALHRGARQAGRSRLRHVLMATEVAIATVVLIAAALFVRGFAETRDIDPGFTREGVLLAAYDVSGRNLSDPDARAVANRLLHELNAVPQIEAAAIAVSVPLDIHGLPVRGFSLEGRVKSDATPDQASSNTVTPGYFRVMGIPMIAGTDFASLDDQQQPPQAIVNDAFVRRFIGEGAVLGRRITSRGRQYTIVAVVRTSISDSFSEPPTPAMYFSYRDRPAVIGELHVRTAAGTERLVAPAVDRAVRAVDPTIPVYDVRTLADHIDKNLFLRRIPARMFVVLGPVLLLVAAIGIYGVVAYTVSQRVSEIGVRMALGASVNRVVAGLVADSVRVIAVGGSIGWTLAFLVAIHLVRNGVSASVFVGVPAAILVVATVACWLPARRAATIDPVVALRGDG